MTNKTFTQAEIDEYRSFIEDQMSGYFTDAQLIEMMAGDEPEMTNKTYELGNKVTPKSGRWQQIICTICEIRTTGIETRYRLNDGNGDGVVWYTFDELDAYAPESAPAAAPAPVNNAPVEPKPQDEYIQDLENALRSALVNGKTYLREVDRLGARITELETELADLRGDMERLAAREMELLQQNSVLFHSLDRIAASQEKLQTAARDACAEYGGDMADDAMHTLADTIGYPWN